VDVTAFRSDLSCQELLRYSGVLAFVDSLNRLSFVVQSFDSFRSGEQGSSREEENDTAGVLFVKPC